ncbi:MAG TPA: hypothetical protein VMG37_18960 [Solirubrobacteraceae bacterium]|nr:hypothetical protein [Solirubrobacteraceae bacterium]
MSAHSLTAGDRFIILRVAYERPAARAASLEWIAPELKDAGLTLIEDNRDGWNPSCEWAGLVDRAKFDRLAAAWHLYDENDPPASDDASGQPMMQVHTLDGMNWETGGESPILSVTVHLWAVQDEDEAHTRSQGPLPFTYVG